jgi:hypothetical protein
MLTNTYIGIDPGATGGICAVNAVGDAVFSHKFNQWSAVYTILNRAKEHGSVFPGSTLVVGLEEVHGHPGMNVKAITTFMKNVGGWERLLDFYKLQHIMIPPARWQKSLLGSFPKGESKIRAFEFAIKRWPELNLTKTNTGCIDGLCIAEYTRRLHEKNI